MRPLPENRRLPKKAKPVAHSDPEVLHDDDAPKAAAPKRPSRWIPRLRAALSGARVLAGVALFLGVAGGVALGLYRYVSSSPRFALQKLVVSGGKQRTERDVSRITGVEVGRNVFSIDLEETRKKLLQDPWVERAEVRRKLPGTLSVDLVERVPVAVVVLSGQLYLASSEGDVMKRIEPGDPSDFVVITGIGGEGDLVRDPVGVKNLVKKAEDLASDYDRLGPASRFPLAEVHVGEDGSFSLVVGKDPVVLSLGRAPFRTKLERASRVLSEVDRRKAHASIVFLDNEAHPERVVARFK